jgi:hypothetical protein
VANIIVVVAGAYIFGTKLKGRDGIGESDAIEIVRQAAPGRRILVHATLLLRKRSTINMLLHLPGKIIPMH